MEKLRNISSYFDDIMSGNIDENWISKFFKTKLMVSGAVLGGAQLFLNNLYFKKKKKKSKNGILPFILGLAVGAGAVVAYKIKSYKKKLQNYLKNQRWFENQTLQKTKENLKKKMWSNKKKKEKIKKKKIRQNIDLTGTTQEHLEMF